MFKKPQSFIREFLKNLLYMPIVMNILLVEVMKILFLLHRVMLKVND
jgi:hypothetical protein